MKYSQVTNFSILLNELDDNKELSSNEMVNKFIETANKSW